MPGLRDYVPGLQEGFKVFPQDIAGMLGIPYVGNVWYVDATNGSDTANPGTAANQAFKTLYKAHSSAVNNNHDVIIINPGGVGSGTGTEESVYGAWTWTKNLTHVIGNAAPSRISQRARVLWGTAGQSTSAALLTFEGSGCIVANVQFATFVDNNILFQVKGDRNYFNNVHFAGIGNATAGDDTAARSLWLADGDENVFEACTIGLDTVARSTSNAELEFTGESQRNQFLDCLFLCFADNAGHLFVKANTAGSDIDRFALFKNCGFINPINSTATTMTDAMALHASLAGSIVLIDCYKIGATGWADNLTTVQALGVSSNATYDQGIGFPVNPSA